MIKDRYLTEFILEDLKEKMVFIGGPRQVGKTTFAKSIISKHFSSYDYFNWDFRDDRKRIINTQFNEDDKLLIFDEIHKYKNWKNYIKGIYDKLKEKHKFIVTGSARLDLYRRGGDSLQGRYHYWRLFPFSLSELTNNNEIKISNPFEKLIFKSNNNKEEFEILFNFGGFPEPLIKQNKRVLRRWHNEKLERMFKEDIRDIETIRDLNSMKILSDILPYKVGSLLSINSLSNELEIGYKAISNWLNILENFYYIFRIYPFTSKKIRSLKKEPKLYLWDWSEIEDESLRFENMIAMHLYKFVCFLKDYEGYKAELFFLRNVDKKEVDFLITINQKPWFGVEVKLNKTNISSNIHYFKQRLNIPYNYQVIMKNDIDFTKDEIRVISADKFLSALV